MPSKIERQGRSSAVKSGHRLQLAECPLSATADIGAVIGCSLCAKSRHRGGYYVNLVSTRVVSVSHALPAKKGVAQGVVESGSQSRLQPSARTKKPGLNRWRSDLQCVSGSSTLSPSTSRKMKTIGNVSGK